MTHHSPEPYVRPPTQATRHARTVETAQRRTAPWTPEEDAELAQESTDDEIEAFAVRWSRTFNAVAQRRRRPRTQRVGTGWVQLRSGPSVR